MYGGIDGGGGSGSEEGESGGVGEVLTGSCHVVSLAGCARTLQTSSVASCILGIYVGTSI